MQMPKHVSASSLTGFTDCASKWITERNIDTKVDTSNQWADAGTIVHQALELWRDPKNSHEQSYDVLEAIFKQYTSDLKLSPTLGVYKRSLELLKKAYAMAMNHPTIPVALAMTIAVEIEIADYQPEGWPLPLKGFLDRLAIVTADPDKPEEIVLLCEDYKTGRQKSWAELTTEDLQPVLYVAWLRDVMVPHIEAQGYTVKKIALVWSYISDGTSVPMYESDFDTVTAKWYVASVSQEMIDFVNAYNEVPEDNRNAFLAKYEKPNKYCSYCIRKNVCQTFQRLLDQELVIDLTSPDTKWADIIKAYNKFKAIGKEGDARKKEVEDLIRAYLDQERTDVLPIEEMGVEFTANAIERKEHHVKTVAEILGTEIVLNAASITQDAVEKELARIALSDPDRANQLREELSARMSRGPGARIVRERKIRKIKAAA